MRTHTHTDTHAHAQTNKQRERGREKDRGRRRNEDTLLFVGFWFFSSLPPHIFPFLSLGLGGTGAAPLPLRTCPHTQKRLLLCLRVCMNDCVCVSRPIPVVHLVTRFVYHFLPLSPSLFFLSSPPPLSLSVSACACVCVCVCLTFPSC